MPSRLTIVIPCFRERTALLRVLPRLGPRPGVEVIVAAAAGGDGTARTAFGLGARVLVTPRCRGLQMDLGARAAGGEHLLFLHADAVPPAGFVRMIRETLVDPDVAVGAFSLSFDRGGLVFATIARATRLRVALTRTPYGDQGLFLRRGDYFARGGFRHWPLLEDVDLVRRHRRHGRIAIRPDRIAVSARRYVEEGLLSTVLRHRAASILWSMRVTPETIRRGVTPGALRAARPEVLRSHAAKADSRG